jgi:hypothetical protein
MLQTAPIYFHTNWFLLTPFLFLCILLSHHVPISKIVILLFLDALLIGKGMQDSTNQSLFITGYGLILPFLYAHFEWRKTKYAFYLTLVVLAMYPLIGLGEEIQKNDRRIMGLFTRIVNIYELKNN